MPNKKRSQPEPGTARLEKQSRDTSSRKPLDAVAAEVEPVRLKPVFGVHPGTYITFALISFAVFFLVLVLIVPGLRNRGVVYRITSRPSGATVHIDGVRVGSTPLESRIAHGDRTVDIGRPHVETRSVALEVRARVVASAIVPPRDALHVDLGAFADLASPGAAGTAAARRAGTDTAAAGAAAAGDTDSTGSDRRAIARQAAGELSERAAIGEHREERPIPPILTPAITDLIAAGTEREVRREFLLNRIPDITSPALLSDFLRAFALSEGGGVSASPRGIAATVNNIIHLKAPFEGVLRWLDSVLPTSSASQLRATAFFADAFSRNPGREDGYEEYIRSVRGAVAPGVRRRDFGGETFLRIPSGAVLLGFSELLGSEDRSATRVRRDVPDFYLAQTPVTVGQYRMFLVENERWRMENTDSLVSAGLADDGYLFEFDAAAEDQPVTGVSYHAAVAFAEWFGERYGVAARLPTEAEWAWAAVLDRHEVDVAGGAFSRGTGPAVVSGDRAGAIGLIDMLGNVWEWTSTAYGRADYLLRYGSGRDSESEPLGSDAHDRSMVVRGGSWANARASVGIESRGGQPAHWATPFLGFRLAIDAD